MENSTIISIFDRDKKAREAAEEGSAAKDEAESFADTMKRNEKAKERMRQERIKANESVLRSYRIKK